jgi:hypothetical protein
VSDGIYIITHLWSIKVCSWGGVRVVVFNATFNKISDISWLSVLLVEETGVPGETTIAGHKLYHITLNTINKQK